MPILVVEVVRVKLGTREITLSFARRGERPAWTASPRSRGSSAASRSPARAATSSSTAMRRRRSATTRAAHRRPTRRSSLYHDRFSQVYDVEQKVDVRSLLLRLEPHVDPSTRARPGPRFIVAEQGLGPALIHYFVRSQRRGRGRPSASGRPEARFDEGPVRRYIMRIPAIPEAHACR